LSRHGKIVLSWQAKSVNVWIPAISNRVELVWFWRDVLL